MNHKAMRGCIQVISCFPTRDPAAYLILRYCSSVTSARLTKQGNQQQFTHCNPWNGYRLKRIPGKDEAYLNPVFTTYFEPS